MTNGEAIDTLNREQHQGSADWYWDAQPAAHAGGWARTVTGDHYLIFEPFEAIAIAEKYRRKAGEHAPVVRFLPRPSGHGYDVLFAENGVKLGEALRDDGGDLIFWPEEDGAAWQGYIMRAIADEMDARREIMELRPESESGPTAP